MHNIWHLKRSYWVCQKARKYDPQPEETPIKKNEHRNGTDHEVNRQIYVHLAILNVFHLFKEIEEKHAYYEERNERR